MQAIGNQAALPGNCNGVKRSTPKSWSCIRLLLSPVVASMEDVREVAPLARMPWGRPISVLRGGSWNNDSQNTRAAYRNDNRRDNFNNNEGFRLARAADDPAFPASKSARVLFAGNRRTRPPMLNQRGLVPAEARVRRTRLSGQLNRKYVCLPQPTENVGNNGCVVCHPCRDARGRRFCVRIFLLWLLIAFAGLPLAPPLLWERESGHAGGRNACSP